MINCIYCNNRGYIHDGDGNITLCPCRFHDSWDEYLCPLQGFISPSDKTSLSKLTNCNQVITNTAGNIAGLMTLMLSDWFPDDFVITSMEELNAIGFERHNVFKSIYEFASKYRYFIVDVTYINPIRAKKAGLNDNDTMYLLDLVKMIIPTCQKIVIIIKPSIANFARYYKELCNGLANFGIKYFHIGNYEKIPMNNDFGGNNCE